MAVSNAIESMTFFHALVHKMLIAPQQVEDELAKYLSQMKMMLQGTQGTSAFLEAFYYAEARHQMLKAAQSRSLLSSIP